MDYVCKETNALKKKKVLYFWAKSQLDVEYTLQWQRGNVKDESESSTWRFSVVLTPTPKSTKSRGDCQPLSYRCMGLEGSAYEFNNPYIAMDVLSTGVLPVGHDNEDVAQQL